MNIKLVEDGVRVIARFGWIRAFELGLFLYPSVNTSQDVRRTMTRRVILDLKRLQLVEERVLLGGSEALYLTKKGAVFAEEVWEVGVLMAPPRFQARDWQHDCYVAQMAYAVTLGNLGKIVTEKQIISSEPTGRRRPDGLVMLYDSWFLIEVENARKSGANLRNQAHRIAQATRGEIEYCDRQISGAMVFYPVNVPGVNHRTRLINALHDVGIQDGVGPYLQLIGFEVRSRRHAISRLTVNKHGLVFSALNVELGLPEAIHTGQSRGPKCE